MHRPSARFLARYANRLLGSDVASVDGDTFLTRLRAGPLLARLVYECGLVLHLEDAIPFASLKRLLSDRTIDLTSTTLHHGARAASCSGIIYLDIHPEPLVILGNKAADDDLLDLVIRLETLIAQSKVRKIDPEVPTNGACQWTVPKFQGDFPIPASACFKSYVTAAQTGRSRSTVTFLENPYRNNAHLISNHAYLIILSWINYLHIKIHNIPRGGPNHYKDLCFTLEMLQDLGNCIFGMYQLMGNEGNVEINVKPYPELHEHFLRVKGNVDSFFRVTFGKRHTYALTDFLVFTASFKCPIHDFVCADEDLIMNPEGLLIILCELFSFCLDLAYIVPAKKMTAKMARSKRLTVAQRANLYEFVPFPSVRPRSARLMLRFLPSNDAHKETACEGLMSPPSIEEEVETTVETHPDAIIGPVSESEPDSKPPLEQNTQLQPEPIPEPTVTDAVVELAPIPDVVPIPSSEEKFETEPPKQEPKSAIASDLPINDEVKTPELKEQPTLASELEKGPKPVPDVEHTPSAPKPDPSQCTPSITAQTIVRTPSILGNKTLLAWPDFKTAIQICEELSLFYDLQEVQDILQHMNDLYTYALNSDFLSSMVDATEPPPSQERSRQTKNFVLGFYERINELLNVLTALTRTVDFLPNKPRIDITELSGFFQRYTGSERALLTVSAFVLVRQVYFALANLLCPTCTPFAEADATFNRLVRKWLRADLLTHTACADTSHAVCKTTRAFLDISNPNKNSALTKEEYEDNFLELMAMNVLSYGLCLSCLNIDILDDITATRTSFFLESIDFLRVSLSVDDRMRVTGINVTPCAQVRHMDLPFQCYVRELITTHFSNITMKKLLQIVEALELEDMDLDSEDLTRRYTSKYSRALVTAILGEVRVAFRNMMRHAEECVIEPNASEQDWDTSETMAERPRKVLLVASSQRETFQQCCTLIRELTEKICAIQATPTARILFAYLLDFVIEHQQFDLSKLLEGADIMLLTMLPSPDIVQLLPLLRLLRKKEPKTILLNNPFPPLLPAADLVTVQTPNGGLRSVRLSEDNIEMQVTRASLDLKRTSDIEPQLTSKLKPILLRFKEVVYKYPTYPLLHWLFACVLKILFAALPHAQVNDLLVSSCSVYILFTLCEDSPKETVHGLLYSLVMMSPYIASEECDSIAERLLAYIGKEEESIKHLYTELSDKDITSVASLETTLRQVVVVSEILREGWPVFGDALSGDMLMSYLVKLHCLYQKLTENEVPVGAQPVLLRAVRATGQLLDDMYTTTARRSLEQIEAVLVEILMNSLELVLRNTEASNVREIEGLLETFGKIWGCNGSDESGSGRPAPVLHVAVCKLIADKLVAALGRKIQSIHVNTILSVLEKLPAKTRDALKTATFAASFSALQQQRLLKLKKA
ncbi:hypothetical protein GMRT_14243 [Giardia muris]|uniref:Uncharacterized protein n=1 Tax=Giardia muris TaxID=5742 RepID=A0A4Z1SWW4_GIAMU|nr:hypothetical protein GMRT_14243 [Giardia muris]|eukprot:TNJ30216.1 hypothetical protein GMRT_14243 [Giardia muris]